MTAVSVAKKNLCNIKHLIFSKYVVCCSQINDGTTDIVLKSSLPFNAPTSPLRIIPPHENIITSSLEQRISSPVTQEDEEVVSIVRLGESTNYPLRQCDSVLQEVERGMYYNMYLKQQCT